MSTSVKFRNVSNDDRIVGYGLISRRTVAADDVLEVPAESADAYRGQEGIWLEVAPMKSSTGRKAKGKTDDAGTSSATEADDNSAGSEATS